MSRRRQGAARVLTEAAAECEALFLARRRPAPGRRFLARPALTAAGALAVAALALALIVAHAGS